MDALRVTSDVLRFASRRVPIIETFEGADCAGFLVPVSSLRIPIENTVWNYSDDPAVIRVTFENGSELAIFLHPDRPIKVFLKAKEQPPRTTAAFRKQCSASLVVVPTLGPVEQREYYLTDKTVSKSENTRTAHRHLRNILVRMTDDDFLSFSDKVSSAWPGIELERPQVNLGDNPMDMMFLEDGIPRELYWSGFGLQVWMQMILQFMRGSENSILILDEPDVYLHPELQLRMIELAEQTFGQVFVATHSSTIVERAAPQDVLHISAKEGTARRGA